jgi:phage terminase large subunit
MIDKPATYWHMLPAYSQGCKAIWTAVNPHTGERRIDEAFPHELRANTNEQEMFIRLKNGATWQVLGSDRYDAAVGSPPYGITFSEWALSNPAAWAYFAPIVIESGGWALFITTARGRIPLIAFRIGSLAEIRAINENVAKLHGSRSSCAAL